MIEDIYTTTVPKGDPTILRSGFIRKPPKLIFG